MSGYYQVCDALKTGNVLHISLVGQILLIYIITLLLVGNCGLQLSPTYFLRVFFTITLSSQFPNVTIESCNSFHSIDIYLSCSNHNML